MNVWIFFVMCFFAFYFYLTYFVVVVVVVIEAGSQHVALSGLKLAWLSLAHSWSSPPPSPS